MESAKTLPSERRNHRGKNKGKNLRRTLLIAAVIASLMTVTALASEFYGFGSLVREEREQPVAREQSDGSLETPTVYDIGQTRPYEGPDWAMEWVDKAREAFGEWRSYKEEKLDAYYREKLPNLKDILTMMDDGGSDYGGVDVQDNGDGTYTFTGLVRGAYTLTAEREGYEATEPVSVYVSNGMIVIDWGKQDG